MKLIFKYAILVIFSICFTGCSPKRSENIKQTEVLAKCDELDEGYLTQDVEGARRCLYQKADLVERATMLEPIGRSAILTLTYARLYVLDLRNEKTWEAEADLVKAKFWALKCAELRGQAPGIAMKNIQEENAGADSAIAWVDGRDKAINNGKLPIYLNSSHFTNRPVGKN